MKRYFTHFLELEITKTIQAEFWIDAEHDETFNDYTVKMQIMYPVGSDSDCGESYLKYNYDEYNSDKTAYSWHTNSSTRDEVVEFFKLKIEPLRNKDILTIFGGLNDIFKK